MFRETILMFFWLYKGTILIVCKKSFSSKTNNSLVPTFETKFDLLKFQNFLSLIVPIGLKFNVAA